MKQIPSTIVVSMFLLILAAWPSMNAWGDTSLLRHLCLHACYFASGALFGLQTAWWASDSKRQVTNDSRERAIS